MGFNFRKSIKIGPARVNLSKSGVGYSIGAGGIRYTSRANSKKNDHASSGNKKKFPWKIIVGIFFIIGGLGNLPDNLGAFAFGLIAGLALLIWGILQSKKASN